jgi:hypothetical protein
MPSTSAMLTMMMKIKNRPILFLPCVKRRLSVAGHFLSACCRALMSPFGKLHQQIAVATRSSSVLNVALHLVENTPFGSLRISRSLPPFLDNHRRSLLNRERWKSGSPAWGKRGFPWEVRNRAGAICFNGTSGEVKKGSKQQRRLSGVCSLGGVAVELDRQFPSTG